MRLVMSVKLLRLDMFPRNVINPHFKLHKITLICRNVSKNRYYRRLIHPFEDVQFSRININKFEWKRENERRGKNKFSANFFVVVRNAIRSTSRNSMLRDLVEPSRLIIQFTICP